LRKDFLSSNDYDYTIGAEFALADGSFRFPEEEQSVSFQKRTCFGPGVSHSAIMIERTNHTIAEAIKYRLLAARFPLEPGRHQALFRQQGAFIAVAQDFLLSAAVAYAPHFDEYHGREEEARRHHADPHPKKVLRVHAYDDLQTTGDLYNNTSHWLYPNARSARVEMMLKYEYSKGPEKPGRAVIDFHTNASLAGAWLMNIVKEAQSVHILEANGGHFRFVKSPDPFVMQDVFEKLYNPPGRFYFVYFSDDSTLAIRVNGVLQWYNLDISSCDASHSEFLFQALLQLFPEHCLHDARSLVAQCRAPLRVRANSLQRGGPMVEIKFRNPRLFSGSTLTTAINNLASLLIGYAISFCDEITPATLTAAAERAGYVVTGCEPLRDFSKVQFLKHSPVFDVCGKIRPLLNLGVLLRASGTCKEDLPGRGPIRSRGQSFQYGLLQGMYPRAVFPLITAMKKSTPPLTCTKSAFVGQATGALKTVDNPLYPVFHITSEEVYRRYELTTCEQDELDYQLGVATFGTWINNSAAQKILDLDYGITTNTDYSPPVMLKTQRVLLA